MIILLPLLLLAGALWGVQRRSPADLTPLWSDEVYYWHQAASFQATGLNGGYYSVAEQPAALGSFYAWGMFVPAFEGAIGKLLGWPLNAIPLFSAVLFGLTLAIFIRIVRPDVTRLLALGAVLLTFAPLWLYHATSMLETLLYAVIVLIAAVFYSVIHAEMLSWKLRIAALLIVFAAALLRSTTGILLIPLCLLLQRRNSIWSILGALILGVILSASAWGLVALTSAPFVNPLSAILTAFKAAPSQALDLTLQNLNQNLASFNRGETPEIALRWEIVVILALLIVTALLGLSRPIRRLGIVLSGLENGLHFYNLALLLALVVLFYNVYEWRDFRVLAPHVLLTALLLVAYRRRVWLIAFIGAGVLLLPAVLPIYTGWSGDHLAAPPANGVNWNQQFAQVIVYQPDAPSPWCNTLLHTDAYFAAEDAPLLLAVPPGIGLSFLSSGAALTAAPKSRYLLLDANFYAQNQEQLKVRPLLAAPGGMLYLNLDAICLPPGGS